MEGIMFNLGIELWQVYILIGIVLCGLEIFAPGFVLLPIGLAFFSTAIAILKVLPFIRRPEISGRRSMDPKVETSLT